jgi:hypothetical protein
MKQALPTTKATLVVAFAFIDGVLYRLLNVV